MYACVPRAAFCPAHVQPPIASDSAHDLCALREMSGLSPYPCLGEVWCWGSGKQVQGSLMPDKNPAVLFLRLFGHDA